MDAPEPRVPLVGKDLRLRRLSVTQQRVLWGAAGLATGLSGAIGIGLVLIPTTVTLAVLSRRRGPHWRWRTYLVGVVTPYVLAVVVFVAAVLLDVAVAAFQPAPFDSNGWRTRPEDRARWTASLLRSDRLPWRTRTEVLAQLGPPEPWSLDDEPAWLVPHGGLGVRRRLVLFADEQPALQLSFDEHDRVVRVRLTRGRP